MRCPGAGRCRRSRRWWSAERDASATFSKTSTCFLSDRDFVAGDSFTVADIDALVMVDFGCRVTKKETGHLDHLSAWAARMRNRPAIHAES